MTDGFLREGEPGQAPDYTHPNVVADDAYNQCARRGDTVTKFYFAFARGNAEEVIRALGTAGVSARLDGGSQLVRVEPADDDLVSAAKICLDAGGRYLSLEKMGTP